MGWQTAGNIRGPKGDKGDKGDPGQTGPQGDAGPAGLEWRGAWSQATTYSPNDSVGWGGSTYFALDPAPAQGTPPTGTAADPGASDTALNTGWQALAIQGSQGPKGDKGDKGDVGSKGDPGDAGPAGTRGSQWFTGSGAPGTIAGAIPGDKYLDISNGDVYNLT